MNYLAHMQLSCSDDYLLMGNFLADMLDLHETEKLPEAYQQGVKLHRLIDSFTDTHPVVSEVNKLLHPNHHKYAPVVSDVIFDYFLALNWSKFESRPLESFCQMVYQIIGDHMHLLSGRKRNMVEHMVADNFLMKYTNIEGMQFVFNKMSARSRYVSNFPKAIEDIEIHYDEINRLFNLFYPDLVGEVNRFCRC